MSKIKNKIVLLGAVSYLITCNYAIEVKSLSCIKFSSKRNSSNIKSSVSRSAISNLSAKRSSLSKLSDNIDYKNLSFREIKEYEKASSSLLKTLTKNERKALGKYFVSGYDEINRFLSGETKQNTKLEEKIKNMDSAIAKYNLEDNIIVYRGTDRKYYENLKVNDIIEEKVYYSTSLSQEVAEQFVIDRKNPSDGILVEIKVPKGSNVLYIGNNGSFEFEQEMLIGRNTKYKVLEIGRYRIILEIIN